MSLVVTPAAARRPAGAVSRSQSFAGFSAAHERNRRSRATPRRSTTRSARMFAGSSKSPGGAGGGGSAGGGGGGSSPRAPQPQRLDDVYGALKKGLGEFLQAHHNELETMTIQQKEMKRNSRLGFVYDLDKQIKSTERFIRRLEFHVSKVEELYETYGIQRRLRDGARRMMAAYETSPGSREARDTLQEVTRGHREYTESLCVIENELESLLGEFHIRMKGLAGFARLCPGDQYEIFMRYGRQRWRLRGRIDSDDKQSWDSEETLLVPLISDLLHIKVTELKSLATHVVVGSVVCETRDLLTVGPQLVAVDINDLGTIKLNLEVTWNPFDKEDQAMTPGTIGKMSAASKRLSLYSQSPPDTPSLREQAFYNMLRRHDELENGATSSSLSSDSTDGSASPRAPPRGGGAAARRRVVPEYQPPIPELDAAAPGSGRGPETSSSAASAAVSPASEPRAENGESNRRATPDADRSPPRGESGRAPAAGDGVAACGRALGQISEGSDDSPEERGGATGDVGTDDRPDSPADGAARDSANDGPREDARSTVAPDREADADARDADAGAGDAAAGEASSQKRSPPATRADGTSGRETRPAKDGLLLSADPADIFFTDKSKDVVRFFNVPVVPCEGDPGDATGGRRNETAAAGTGDRTEGRSGPAEPLGPGPSPERAPRRGAGNAGEDSGERLGGSGLEQAWKALCSALDGRRGRYEELRVFEQEVANLDRVLQPGGKVSRSRESSISLSVETALESFNFLHSPDLDDDQDDEVVELEEVERAEEEEMEGHPETAESEGKPHAELVDAPSGAGDGSELSPGAPTTGSDSLDLALALHAALCTHLLANVGAFGPLRCSELRALDRLQGQAPVLRRIGELARGLGGGGGGEGPSVASAVPELCERECVLRFWERVAEPGAPLCATARRLARALASDYAETLAHTDTVCVRLLERLLCRRVRRLHACVPARVTAFQLAALARRHDIRTMDSFITQIGHEVSLSVSLESHDGAEVLRGLRRLAGPDAGAPRLRAANVAALAPLLMDSDSKISQSAAAILRRAASDGPLGEKVAVWCLQLLEDEDETLRRAGCAALACLQAKESTEQLLHLCQVDQEPVRLAAKDALFSFGKEGEEAYRRMEESTDGVRGFITPGARHKSPMSF